MKKRTKEKRQKNDESVWVSVKNGVKRMSVQTGANFISEFFDKRKKSREQSHTIDGALGLLLPKGSMLRDWHRHPERREQIHNLLADNPLQCSLLIMSESDFETHGEVYEEGAVFQSIAANEDLKFPWVLLEPLHTDPGASKFRYRKWNQASVVFFDEFHRQDAKTPVENPRDDRTPRRRWSPDTVELCRLVRERFMDPSSEKIIHGVLVKTVTDKLKVAAAGTVALGVIACSVAAAVCTGTGAITLSASLAQSIAKGAISTAGSRLGGGAIDASLAGTAAGAAAGAAAGYAVAATVAKPPMPPLARVDESKMTPIELLAARVDRLEHAVFDLREASAVRAAGDAVASAIARLRGKTI